MNTYSLDLHVHTAASADGCSRLEDLVLTAKSKGLDAIAITDHNLCTPVPESLEGVLLIPGCEISTSAGHITGLFLQESINLEALGHLPAPEKAVEAIHQAGGIAVLAHPFQRSGASKASFAFSVDAVETANARAALKVPDANQKAETFASERSLPGIGGSDAHHVKEIGNAFTRVVCPEPTLTAFRRAILSGEATAVFVRKTTHREKGRSQWVKARRSGSPYRICRGAAYRVYCILLDILQSGKEYF